MSDSYKLKEDYVRAKCCSPAIGDAIVGYYSHNNLLKVHRSDCASLAKADPARLVTLHWNDIVETEESFEPDETYHQLDRTDFAILAHHLTYGIDYSLVVARKVGLDKQEAFERHSKLREAGCIKRVEPRIVQYRKGIVDNKWIKHRNHTYYDLTDYGRACLQYYKSRS